MRIIKYYEHTVNPGEVVPLRLSALERIIADSVCNLLNNGYQIYGSKVVKIEFERADVQYVYHNRRREARFKLDLSSRDGIVGVIFVTINYNTNELISVESNIEHLFNRALFKDLSFRLTENEKEKNGQLNEWLKEAAKPKIWTSTANVYIDPAIREIHERFMKNEREAIWDAYIPDTIKRYIENDPIIMSKNYISEEEKGMEIKISLDEFEAICKKACCEYFNDKPKADQYCYATNNRDIDTDRIVLKVGLSFIPNNPQKCSHLVIFTVNGVSGDVDYAACPSLPSGTGDALCGIICRMIRNQCMRIEYTIPLGDVMILNKYISKEENNMIEGKKCINRANVYKTMTDDQKIVMQDAISNAVESTIKDCRMEYEKALRAYRLKIENYKGLINNIYGTEGMLSKLDRLKDSLEVQKIIINEPAMIVFWKDGTKTVVTATDEEFDEEKGLAMAYAKKWLGNNYAAGGRFKAKLKHAERVKRKEETVETDIYKIPICKEIMDEAMRRVKVEMEADAAKEPAKKTSKKKK